MGLQITDTHTEFDNWVGDLRKESTQRFDPEKKYHGSTGTFIGYTTRREKMKKEIDKLKNMGFGFGNI